MAIADFLTNFRRASQFVPPWADVGDAPVTAEQLSETARYARLWLTPKAVEGFDSSAFYDLTETERRELEQRVEAFRRFAEQLPSDRQPTADEVREARRLFVAIRKVVGRYVYDWKLAEVIKALDRVRSEPWFPPFVVAYDVQFGHDHTGDPAVWVSFVVTDEAAEDDRIVNSLPYLRKGIYDLLDAMGIDRIVYLYNFRTVSEEQELLEGVLE